MIHIHVPILCAEADPLPARRADAPWRAPGPSILGSVRAMSM